jgi:hypothetical protein
MSEDYASRYHAKLALLERDGFAPQVFYVGRHALLKNTGEAAMCLRCFALVPIANMSDEKTTTEHHAEWHRRPWASRLSEPS